MEISVSVTRIRHLYFHIPFCPKLCPYCSFFVEVGAENKTTAFLDALLRDVERAAGEYEVQPETIYFGGGTPSSLLVDQLEHSSSGYCDVPCEYNSTAMSIESSAFTI